MENSQVERSAVAAVATPKISLKVLVDALAVLRAVDALKAGEVVPVSTLVAASMAALFLGAHVDRMLDAQSVGVTA